MSPTLRFFTLFLLTLLLFPTKNDAAPRLATCTATTHYACGVQIGTSQHERIHAVLQTQHGQTLARFISTTLGSQLFQTYLELHRKVYPHLVDEINGTAVGAQVPFSALFALNIEFELMSKGNLTTNGFEKGCSDYHLIGQGCKSIVCVSTRITPWQYFFLLTFFIFHALTTFTAT